MSRRNLTAAVLLKELKTFPPMFYLFAEWRVGTTETFARTGELRKIIIAAAPYPTLLEGLRSRVALMTRNDFKVLVDELRQPARNQAEEQNFRSLMEQIWTKPHLGVSNGLRPS